MPTRPAAPPRPELVALLDAIKERPYEPVPRYALADWLAAQKGALNAERAKFLRDQTARMIDGSPPAPTPAAQRSMLRLWPRWLGPIAKEAQGTFLYGLPEIGITGAKFLKPAFVKLLAGEHFAYVQRVRLSEMRDGHYERLANLPELRHVFRLDITADFTVKPTSVAEFLASPHLTGMRQLDLREAIGDPHARAVAGNAALAGLRVLSLWAVGLGDTGAAALANSPHLTSLTHLNISLNKIGDAGAEALANSPHLRNLKELRFGYNRKITARGRALLRDRFGDGVELQFGS